MDITQDRTQGGYRIVDFVDESEQPGKLVVTLAALEREEGQEVDDRQVALLFTDPTPSGGPKVNYETLFTVRADAKGYYYSEVGSLVGTRAQDIRLTSIATRQVDVAGDLVALIEG